MCFIITSKRDKVQSEVKIILRPVTENSANFDCVHVVRYSPERLVRQFITAEREFILLQKLREIRIVTANHVTWF